MTLVVLMVNEPQLILLKIPSPTYTCNLAEQQTGSYEQVKHNLLVIHIQAGCK